MAMMTKMRDNAHVFIIAFVIIFVAFWVVSDLDISSVLRGSQNDIGNIDGKSITYQEFQQMVDQMSEQRRQQNNGQELDENALSSIREQVWNDYITRAVIDNAVAQFGISVSDDEINDWVRSEQPPEALAQHFRDSTGQFNRDAYENFLANPGPENQQALIQIEKQLKDDLIRQKLTAVLSSVIQIGDEELKEKFIDQNVQLSASYIYFEPRTIASKDTTAPSEDEYKTFYDKKKNQFKTKAMRTLKYVLFEERPSASDSNAVRTELEQIAKEAHGGADFLELVKSNSEQQFQDQWVNRQQLTSESASMVFGKPVGSIIGPVNSETGFSLYKIVEERDGGEQLTKASHILLRTDGGQSESAQKAKVEEALRKAKSGEDFSTLAARYSEEPGASERGGDLGWFGKGRMVPEFERATMNAKVGEIVGPVKTQFGYHVIKITGRSSQEIKVAEIRLSIKPSARTRDDLNERARNFAYFANENGFEQESKTSEMKILETTEFAKQSGSYIPNIGVNPALMKFAFENSVGTISEVHRASNGYVVAVVHTIREEGYRTLEEVKQQIAPQVVFQRQVNKTLSYAKSLSSNAASLENIVLAHPELQLQSTGKFILGNGVPSIGRDDRFIGKLLSLKNGQPSAPFSTQRGVYITRLDEKTSFDNTAFKVKKEELRKQNLQQLQNEFIQSWLEQMKKTISIVDNRDRFYR